MSAAEVGARTASSRADQGFPAKIQDGRVLDAAAELLVDALAELISDRRARAS
jgi:hypothetical protein